jgi:hypothetical protein
MVCRVDKHGQVLGLWKEPQVRLSQAGGIDGKCLVPSLPADRHQCPFVRKGLELTWYHYSSAFNTTVSPFVQRSQQQLKEQFGTVEDKVRKGGHCFEDTTDCASADSTSRGLC